MPRGFATGFFAALARVRRFWSAAFATALFREFGLLDFPAGLPLAAPFQVLVAYPSHLPISCPPQNLLPNRGQHRVAPHDGADPFCPLDFGYARADAHVGLAVYSFYQRPLQPAPANVPRSRFSVFASSAACSSAACSACTLALISAVWSATFSGIILNFRLRSAQ